MTQHGCCILDSAEAPCSQALTKQGLNNYLGLLK